MSQFNISSPMSWLKTDKFRNVSIPDKPLLNHNVVRPYVMKSPISPMKVKNNSRGSTSSFSININRSVCTPLYSKSVPLQKPQRNFGHLLNIQQFQNNYYNVHLNAPKEKFHQYNPNNGKKMRQKAKKRPILMRESEKYIYDQDEDYRENEEEMSDVEVEFVESDDEETSEEEVEDVEPDVKERKTYGRRAKKKLDYYEEEEKSHKKRKRKNDGNDEEYVPKKKKQKT